MAQNHKNFEIVARKGTLAFGVYTPTRMGANWGATAHGVFAVVVDEGIGRLGNIKSRAITHAACLSDWAVGLRGQAAIADARQVAAAWAAQS